MKNFKKQINKLGKEYKDISNMGPRCAKALKTIIIQSGGNEKIFKHKLDMKIHHYFGDHKKCDNPSECKGPAPITKIEAQVAFMVCV
jgi:hypothetical protein